MLVTRTEGKVDNLTTRFDNHEKLDDERFQRVHDDINSVREDVRTELKAMRDDNREAHQLIIDNDNAAHAQFNQRLDGVETTVKWVVKKIMWIIGVGVTILALLNLFASSIHITFN